MKICKKCNKEFNEKYDFCPQCGFNYETGKKVKTPSINNNLEVIFIFVFVAIILFIIMTIAISSYKNNHNKTNNNLSETSNNNEISSIKYENAQYLLDDIIEKNQNLEYKYMTNGIEKEENQLKARYAVESDDNSTALTATFNLQEELINFFIIYNIDNNKSYNDAYEIITNSIFNLTNGEKTKIKEILNNKDFTGTVKIKNFQIEKTTKSIINVEIINPSEFANLKIEKNNSSENNVQKTIYELKYNEIGNFGKKQEYEGDQSIFYYFPEGSYKVTRTSGNDKICFLWLFNRKGSQNSFGTTYDSTDKFTYDSDNHSEIIKINDSIMLYNSNTCSYSLELQ